VLKGIAPQVRSETINARWNPARMHDELVYLARMKKEGELTDAEYEAAREDFVNGFIGRQQ